MTKQCRSRRTVPAETGCRPGAESSWTPPFLAYFSAVFARPVINLPAAPVLFAALAAVWLPVFYRLSFTWDTDDQYSHGWMVPALAAWIFARRWGTRPEPAAAGGSCVLLFLLLVLLWWVTAGANLLLESSPDWRMVMWLMAAPAFAASLVIVQLAGGTPWRRHFAFAFFFALASVPWPFDLERWLTIELSLLAAKVTGALLNLGGILALVDGNNIEIDTGVLGVEDACSGVRSFQSSLMVALLLGEWFCFRPGGRIFLCVAGLVTAYALNIARMLFLCLAAYFGGGVSVVGQWHDPAGFTILVVSMAALWLLSLALGLVPGARYPEPACTPRGDAQPSRLLVPVGLVTLAAATLLPVTCEAWYRWHERGRAPLAVWQVRPPSPTAVVDQKPLGLEDGLGYDEGFRRRWQDERGRSIDLIYMRWLPGRKAASAGPHAPDWCQRAAGRTIEAKSPVRLAKVGSLELPYQIYTINDGVRTFYLLFTIDDGRRDLDWSAAGLMGQDSHRRKRLRRLIEGNRNVGQTSLQLAIVGESDPVRAERELVEMLPSLLEMPAEVSGGAGS